MAESKPVTVAGVTYPSFAAAERQHKVKRGVAEQRYFVYGWTLDEAFGLVERKRPGTRPQAVTVRGVSYDTLTAAARAHGVEFSTFKKRLRKGLSPEAALALPGSGYVPPTKVLVVRDTAYASIADACRAHGVWEPVFHNRVKNLGWSMEQALELVPPPNGSKKCLGRIYKVTHQPSGKAYIGLTLSGLRKRWQEHVERALSDRALHPDSLQAAIRSHGANEFGMEEIALAHTLGDLAALERRYIAQFGTRAPMGFNLADGGAGLYAKGKRIVVFGTAYDSIAYACKVLGASLYSVRYWLDAGLSPDDAFSRPLTPKAKGIEFRGSVYGSISELSRSFGVRPGMVADRLRAGETVEQALGLSRRAGPKTQVTLRGLRFDTLREAAQFYGISYSTVDSRRRAGASVEEALTTAVRETTTPLDFNGKQFPSIRVLSQATGVSQDTLYRRLAKGWSVQDAVSRPLRVYRRAAKSQRQLSCTLRNRNEFAMTLTEDSAIAAAATMGERSKPVNG